MEKNNNYAKLTHTKIRGGDKMKNLIGGKFVDASNGEKADVINPATNELIDTVPNVTEEDVNEAVSGSLRVPVMR